VGAVGAHDRLFEALRFADIDRRDDLRNVASLIENQAANAANILTAPIGGTIL